jgi:hypothetical protein
VHDIAGRLNKFFTYFNCARLEVHVFEFERNHFLFAKSSQNTEAAGGEVHRRNLFGRTQEFDAVLMLMQIRRRLRSSPFPAPKRYAKTGIRFD